MIKEVINNTFDWDKEIEIKLSLKDLQFIYDSIGGIPLKYYLKKHENTKFKTYCNNFEINDMYETLQKLIDKYECISDDNCDNYVVLDIVSED